MLDIGVQTREMIEDAWEHWPKRKTSDTHEMFKFFLDTKTRTILSEYREMIEGDIWQKVKGWLIEYEIDCNRKKR